jgi:DNA topoisomerase I
MGMSNIVPEAIAAARAAGLRYVNDGDRGIRRWRHGKGFVYVDATGKRVRDAATLRRIRDLVVPPAWTDVWICSNERGHLQATGRDTKGRKQYRYHTEWRSVRDETKFERMIEFGEVLPRIRARVEADLARAGLPREKVLATVVRLLDVTLIRVGNDEYAKKNRSYGLTTLREDHVDVRGARIRFHFRGKAGKKHFIEVEDPKLARIVRRCQDIPGHELFHYVDEDGQPRVVESGDVNEYLRDISGCDFTAKDFRTWAGTVLAASALSRCADFSSEREAKRLVVGAIRSVAERLGNTPAVCRKSYIHPVVVESFIYPAREVRVRRKIRHASGLHVGEAEVLALLRRHAKRGVHMRASA